MTFKEMVDKAVSQGKGRTVWTPDQGWPDTDKKTYYYTTDDTGEILSVLEIRDSADTLKNEKRFDFWLSTIDWYKNIGDCQELHMSTPEDKPFQRTSDLLKINNFLEKNPLTDS